MSKFISSNYSGAAEAMEADVRKSEQRATVEPKKPLPPVIKLAVGFAVLNSLVYLFGDKRAIALYFRRSE